MSRRARGNHSPAFKAKVALAAIREKPVGYYDPVTTAADLHAHLEDAAGLLRKGST